LLTRHRKQLVYALALSDGLALGAAFAVAFALRTRFPIPFLGSPERPVLSGHIWMLFLALPLFWFLASYNGLDRSLTSKSHGRLVLASLRVFLYVGLILGTAVFVFQAKTFSRAVFFLFLLLASALVSANRLLARRLLQYRKRLERVRRNVIVVGTNPQALDVGRRILRAGDDALNLVGHVRSRGEARRVPAGITLLGEFDDLPRIVEQEVVDEVVFAIPYPDLVASSEHIAWCEEVGVTAHLRLDFPKMLFAKLYPTEWDGLPLLSISATPEDALGLLIKRAMDIAISAAGLVALSPLLLACALAVRLGSPGPVLFRQRRVGLNGRQFTLYKFRSMRGDAEQQRAALESRNEMSGPVFKIRRDPRVTPVGRWLRKFSLDELPQLWNVLRGDMSIVGPRPPVPEEVEKYERWQRRRLSMKPGITCLWQVNGRSRIGFEEWMRLDLQYIDRWSLRLDLAILLRTIPAVLSARGAQ
jgi:exopolysaccharide biosynthesis polyprenyl glycosylphosphotransferase